MLSPREVVAVLKPTGDSIQVMRRAMDDARREAEEASRAGGTEAFQAVRKIRQQIADMEAVQADMIRLFNAMPLNDGRQVDRTGWSVDTAPATGAWTTVASGTITRPANMNRVAVTAIGNAAGIINAAGLSGSPQVRLVIAGTASSPTEGSSEIRGQTVRGVMQASFFREFAPATSVTVELQVRGRMSEFSASNTASMTISAGFTRVGI